MKEKNKRVYLYLPDGQVEAIEGWRKRQSKIPPFSEAVRTLLEFALKTTPERGIFWE